MDEETADTASGTSNTTKVKKKAVAAKQKTDKAAELPKEKKKTLLELICEAIEFSGESKKGLSVQAIKKFVKSKNGSDAPNLNAMINKALAKGIENGTLVRPPASKDATGAVGYFRLAKVEPPKRTIKTVIKKQKREEHSSDSEVTPKPPKQMKRNLSDTYIQEMKGSLTSTPKPLEKQISSSKETKAKKVVQKKKTNDKNTSDSKTVVKKTRQKMNSYSSDTEVDFKKEKVAKTTKEPLKKAKADKPKIEKAEASSKAPKAKVKKLYKSAEEKENEANTKSTKTRSKKQT